MNRRELLKSLPIVAAITPTTIKTIQNGKETETTQAYPLEEGPFYLFVLTPRCNLDQFIDGFRSAGANLRGAIAICPDGDLDNFCRIYKLDEK